jgi:hypothetical protein
MDLVVDSSSAPMPLSWDHLILALPILLVHALFDRLRSSDSLAATHPLTVETTLLLPLHARCSVIGLNRYFFLAKFL